MRMTDKSNLPSFEEYFKAKEEEYFEMNPEFKEHPELDKVDGIPASVYRRRNARFEYDMMKALQAEHREAAAKKKEALKAEYDKKLKDIDDEHVDELTDIDRAMLDMLNDMTMPSDDDDASLTAEVVQAYEDYNSHE